MALRRHPERRRPRCQGEAGSRLCEPADVCKYFCADRQAQTQLSVARFPRAYTFLAARLAGQRCACHGCATYMYVVVGFWCRGCRHNARNLSKRSILSGRAQTGKQTPLTEWGTVGWQCKCLSTRSHVCSCKQMKTARNPRFSRRVLGS